MERRQFVFLGYNPEELRSTPEYEPRFKPGDILAEIRRPKHLGPEEIITVRLEDDVVDAVWPEEVKEL